MPYEIVSVVNEKVHLTIAPGGSVTLGRIKGLDITNISVCKDHCVLECLEGADTHHPTFIVKANRSCHITGPSRQERCKIRAGKSLELSVGETLFLSCDEKGILGDGFKLECSRDNSSSQQLPFKVGSPSRRRASQEQPGAEASGSMPTRKRSRPSQELGRFLPAAEASTDAGEQAAPALGSGDFSGLRFNFWVGSFYDTMRDRARKAGASLADEVGPGVTHVISPRDTSPDQASKRLQETSMQGTVVEYESGDRVALPDGVYFVTPEWVSDCLAQGKLLPEGTHLIDLARMALQAKLQASSSLEPDEDAGGMDAEALVVAKSVSLLALSGKQQAPEAGTNSKKRKRKGGFNQREWAKHMLAALTQGGALVGAELALLPTMAVLWRQCTPLAHHPYKSMEDELRLWQDPGLGFPSMEDEWRLWQDTGLGFPVSHQMLDSSQCSESQARALCLSPVRPALPDDLYHPWDEPFDGLAAKETMQKLYDHYHKQDLSLHKARAAAGVPDPRSPEPHASAAKQMPSVGPDSEDEQGGQSNTECAHVACSAKSFCILRHLAAIKQNYVKDTERFNKMAMDVIMGRVEDLQTPLHTEEDCDRVRGKGVGKDNVDKLKEIVRTGAFRRNETLAKDPHHQAIKLFMSVWGTGEKGAEAWWSQGCRTLDDLRGRTDLTTQQAAGLKYYQDLQQRIPRAEVAAIEFVVREAVLDLLSLKGSADASTLFCHAVGSYIRGKPDTGDVDMLILPPESCIDTDSRLAMHELLQMLHKRGLLLEDMMVKGPSKEGGPGSATFLGLCRHETSPCVRRIDIKWNPRRHMPFAVTHFVGSGLFNRALRYWARTAADQAKAVNTAADGFKLSDSGLVPIKKGPSEKRGDRSYQNTEEELGPSVKCAKESDIFRALGLAYVPFCMRWWYKYE